MAIDIISVTIGFVGGIIGAVSGGVATYFAERKLEKRREKKINNERIYFPLLDELKNARGCISNFSSYCHLQTWLQIHEQHLQYIIPPQIREKIGELNNSIVIFSKGVDASIEEIKEIGEQEFYKRNNNAENPKNIKENMQTIRLVSYTPFINLTVNIARDIIVKKEENCFSAKTKDTNFLFYEKDLDTLKQHLNLEFSTLDEYINFIYSKAKTLPIFIDMKREMPEIVSKIDNLISEIYNQTK